MPHSPPILADEPLAKGGDPFLRGRGPSDMGRAVRVATLDDVDGIVALGRHFFDASGYGALTEYDEASAAATFRAMIENPDAVVLVMDDGGIVGATAALCYPFFFNVNHRHASEFFWWVDEGERGRGTALMRELESRVRAKGARSFAVSTLEAMRPEAVGAIYRRAGFAPTDTTYLKGF